MQKYQYTLEPGLENYYTNVRGELFKILEDGNFRLLKMDRNTYRVKLMGKSISTITKDQVIYNSKLCQGNVDKRITLPYPLSRYMIGRNCLIYNVRKPMTPLTMNGVLCSLVDDQNRNVWVNVMQQVLTHFIYGGDESRSNTHDVITNFDYCNCSFSLTPRENVYLSKHTINFKPKALVSDSIVLIRNMGGYLYDTKTHALFKCPDGESVETHAILFGGFVYRIMVGKNLTYFKIIFDNDGYYLIQL